MIHTWQKSSRLAALTPLALLILWPTAAHSQCGTNESNIYRNMNATRAYGVMQTELRITVDLMDLFEQENTGVFSPGAAGLVPYLPAGTLLPNAVHGFRTVPVTEYEPDSPGEIGYGSMDSHGFGTNDAGQVTESRYEFTRQPKARPVFRRGPAFGPNGEWLTARGPRR